MFDSKTDWSLYQQAITHTSWVEEHGGSHNERLEFIGDAVLQLASSELLWVRYPEAREGELSKMRRLVVNNRFLASLARDLHIGEILRLGRGEEQTGGRLRRRNLAGAYEALLGAIYLDQGYDAVHAVIGAAIAAQLEVLPETFNPKQLLHEWVQSSYKNTPTYSLVGSSGPDHDRRFTMAVSINGEEVAQGEGTSKRSATAAAAEVAAKKLGLLS